MKKCLDCDFYMREARIEGQHPFEIGVDGQSDIRIFVPTGERTNFFGIETDKCIVEKVKTRVCPKCGKVEMYIDTSKFEN